MLWIVTGGVGSGKSAFAEALARTHGREAIKLVCPAWPDSEITGVAPELNDPVSRDESNEMTLPADHTLAERLNLINLRSNPFRANQRIIVVDSLSGWLRQEIEEMRKLFPPPEAAALPRRGRPRKPAETSEVFRKRTRKLEASLQSVIAALLSFEGKRIVVTEETPAGLVRDPWERWYLRELSKANLRLASACDKLYRLTAGFAEELKGTMMKRGTYHDENLYPNRR
ncbi:bifunctional adenosylcobinamide kinase/adenosylcobinamide-phosphate guanylyltransferase [Cohnella lubricantis]|uniref:Bifunctional adenosylcobinamide kinase/adenosylcobinamide-phosphate guanylyltransferase n=1 Tax=Cohnella lubricantis TaxID=2163172 RepID=A0A841TAM0_9BACL|nr:bifunctional adenosylcobinamide kinase/adenosylcobinamide-phosphate guanylyltransferase [Cohnella lubricantis]MBB6678344.1 bifunctional adenosylcobinamide kinase/adenosylcobinamide-phosphate guanylyltransferase [Cohnella lubricantis]MBP2116724.1 adenosyl cobinamide kinase/adenosyl cobinamide phosphate guanylyltransferase [Cohnella lubricantis]